MSTEVPPTEIATVFPVGFNVFYFNQWKGFETKELFQYFSHLDSKELFALKRGDVVWIDEEPYHRNGKVYGYTKRVVWSVEILPNKSIRIAFSPTEFTTFSPSGLGRSIAQVRNEGALKNAIERLGNLAFLFD